MTSFDDLKKRLKDLDEERNRLVAQMNSAAVTQEALTSQLKAVETKFNKQIEELVLKFEKLEVFVKELSNSYYHSSVNCSPF